MIGFTNKFPFISFKKKLTADDYHDAVTLHVSDMSKDNQDLLKFCKDKLTENNISLNKIRFVFEKSFTYDIDRDVINPPYKVIMPKKEKHPVIEIGKPANIMTIYLGENNTYDNYTLLKKLAKKSKRGIVILANDTDMDEVMWLANLDDAVDYYFNMHKYENES